MLKIEQLYENYLKPNYNKMDYSISCFHERDTKTKKINP
jgi:hypothetical protein